MNRVILAALVPLWGCINETGFPGGTGVGNPGSTSMSTRQSGVALEEGAGTLVAIDVTRCPPVEPASAAIGRDVDLLADGPFEIPGGLWCELTVRFDGPLVYAGRSEWSSDPDKGTFDLVLDVPEVELRALSPYIDRGAFVIELGHGGWIDVDDLGGLEDGTHVVVDAAHPAHDDLAHALAFGSALFRDLDGDGFVSDDERDGPPLAFGPDRPDDDHDDDDDEEDEDE